MEGELGRPVGSGVSAESEECFQPVHIIAPLD
jgi:hypothetical protein